MFCLSCKKDNIQIDSGDEYKSLCEECSAEHVECNLCAKLTHMDYLVYRPDLFGITEEPYNNDFHYNCEVCYNCEAVKDLMKSIFN